MPKYFYRCSSCENELEVYHSMSDKLKDCKECETSGSLVRVPSLAGTTKLVKSSPTKAGAVVRQFIEDAKADLKYQKKEAKKEGL